MVLLYYKYPKIRNHQPQKADIFIPAFLLISKVQKESNFFDPVSAIFLFCLFKHLFMKHRKIPKAQYDLHEG
mgnify:CR=1 FL=1